jgi:hypothetical protein
LAFLQTSLIQSIGFCRLSFSQPQVSLLLQTVDSYH